MTRVSGGISTNLNTLHPGASNTQSSKQASTPPKVGSQLQQALFGRPLPGLLDPAKFPDLAALLRMLQRYKKKLAAMAGDEEDDYDVVLAEGGIAMIDGEGTIYVGAGFLRECGEDEALLVGVLAHEIGHRPQRWRDYPERRELSEKELQALCRHEETRADLFAGKALAEMGLAWEPLAHFLKAVEEGPHPEYFDAETRGTVIREAHQGRSARARARREMFPEFHRMTHPKGHLGEA